MGKESACDVGDPRDVTSLPVLGSSPGGRHGNPLEDSCLENPMDRGAWWLQSMGLHRVRHAEETEQACKCQTSDDHIETLSMD